MRLAVLALLILESSQAYSVLTHEAIVDAAWDKHLRPLLLKRYPDATEDQMKQARAYAYGGALVQDMGYVPFSSKTFSDLAHYVRAGDLVMDLIAESSDLNEYAFALGALAHYISDSTGHPVVNRITPVVYAKMRQKFGAVATYEDGPTEHLKTEFALDVIQVARGQYVADSYHAFIGFEVSQKALERSFEQTYGFPMKDLFKSEDMAIGTYRFAVGKLVPEMTRVAWSSKRKDIERLSPGITRTRFLYGFTRKDYEKQWGAKYQQPGAGARFLAFVFKLIPTFGPFKALGFRPVPQMSEDAFLKGFDLTVTRYAAALDALRNQPVPGNPRLTELNLDTGVLVRPGQYQLADKTYAELVDRLAKHHFESADKALRADILAYFGDGSHVTAPAKTLEAVQELRAEEAAQ